MNAVVLITSSEMSMSNNHRMSAIAMTVTRNIFMQSRLEKSKTLQPVERFKHAERNADEEHCYTKNSSSHLVPSLLVRLFTQDCTPRRKCRMSVNSYS